MDFLALSAPRGTGFGTGGQIDKTTRNNESALFTAAAGLRLGPDIVQLLLANGADANIASRRPGREGMTPLRGLCQIYRQVAGAFGHLRDICKIFIPGRFYYQVLMRYL